MVIIEADPAKTQCDDCIHGRGTESSTLIHAGIRDGGIVAGTDDDINNLSIVSDCPGAEPELFMVAPEPPGQRPSVPAFWRPDDHAALHRRPRVPVPAHHHALAGRFLNLARRGRKTRPMSCCPASPP